MLKFLIAKSKKSSSALQPGGMISVLFDYQSASDRYAIADDLSCFDERIVREALIHIATDANEDIDLRKICATSLAEIYWRNKIKDINFVKRMSQTVKSEFENEYLPLIEKHPNGPPKP